MGVIIFLCQSEINQSLKQKKAARGGRDSSLVVQQQTRAWFPLARGCAETRGAKNKDTQSSVWFMGKADGESGIAKKMMSYTIKSLNC